MGSVKGVVIGAWDGEERDLVRERGFFRVKREREFHENEEREHIRTLYRPLVIDYNSL